MKRQQHENREPFVNCNANSACLIPWQQQQEPYMSPDPLIPWQQPYMNPNPLNPWHSSPHLGEPIILNFGNYEGQILTAPQQHLEQQHHNGQQEAFMNGDINAANIVAFLQEQQQQQQQNQEEQIQQAAQEDIDNIFYPCFIDIDIDRN